MADQDSSPEFYRFPFKPLWFEAFDDFAEEISGPYVATSIASGTFAKTTDEAYGVAVLSGVATTDDTGYQLQRDMEIFTLLIGKNTDCFARLKLSEATQSSLFMGLAISDTTIQHATTDTVAGGLTISDGVGWYKPDGEATAYGVIMRDSVIANTGAIVTLVDATYVTLAVRVTMDPTTLGKGTAYFYADGAIVGALNSLTMPYSAEEVLTPSVSFKSGSATGTMTCTVDFLGARQER